MVFGFSFKQPDIYNLGMLNTYPSFIPTSLLWLFVKPEIGVCSTCQRFNIPCLQNMALSPTMLY